VLVGLVLAGGVVLVDECLRCRADGRVLRDGVEDADDDVIAF
jgi:hypothetical protein